MMNFNNINFITIGLVAVLVIPLLSGLLGRFTREKMHQSIESLFDSIEFLFALFLSFYFTKRIFFEQGEGIYKEIYSYIPDTVKEGLFGRDVLIYLLAVPVIHLVIMLLLKLVIGPVYNVVVIPFADGLYSFIDTCGDTVKRLFGALWQVPRAIYGVVIVGLLLNFYTYYFPSPLMSKWMNESPAYQVLYDKAIYPALNSNIAKRIPVLVNDSFREIGMVIPRDARNTVPEISAQIREQLENRNIKVIEYFNGVTLDEAIKSSPEIDEAARKIAGNEKSDKRKAFLLYKWISSNVKYDYDKAERVSKDPRGISSGAVVAFDTRQGICFDYSCLYIAMCRAVGLKVRLITGLAYSGVSWGDHAWNQVFIQEENRWIDVDSTFGSTANYFDKKDFDVDHRYTEVQGEW